jgi:hypothetical protein
MKWPLELARTLPVVQPSLPSGLMANVQPDD